MANLKKKWTPGSKVRVTRGSFKGAIGFLVSEWPKGVWVVNPDENADSRTFYQADLELV